jgi:hypothetical protein
MSAATIPLMGVSPLGAYSQMLNLGALQQDQQQQRQMAPYKLQEAQNSVQLGQMQVQAQQRAAQVEQIAQQTQAQVDAQQGTTPTNPAPQATAPAATPQAAPASAPATATPQNLGALASGAPTPNGSTVPISALQSAPPANLTDPVDGQDDSDAGVADAAAPAQPAAAPAPQASAAPTPQPVAATPAPTSSAKPGQSFEQLFLQNATKAGLASEASRYLQNRAASQVEVLKAQQAQEDQQQQQIANASFKDSNGDLEATRAAMIKNGATPATILKYDDGISAAARAKADAWTAADNVRLQQHNELIPRLDAYIKNNEATPDQIGDTFDGWLDAQHADKLISDTDYQKLQQLHGNGKAPTIGQLQQYRQDLNSATQIAGMAKAQVEMREASAKATTAEAGAEQALTANAAGTLSEAATPKQYDAAKSKMRPDIAAKFPDSQDVFDKDGNADEDVQSGIQRIGQTVQQRVASDQAAATATNLAQSRADNLRVRNRMADIAEEKANRDTKLTIDTANNAAATDAFNANNGDYDKAIAQLKAAKDSHSLAAVGILEARKNGSLAPTKTQAQIDAAGAKAKAAQEAQDLTDTLTGKKPAAAGTTPANSATPAPAKQTAPKAAPTKITVTTPNGRAHYFDTEADAAAFEGRVKKAGGVSTRLQQ